MEYIRKLKYSQYLELSRKVYVRVYEYIYLLYKTSNHYPADNFSNPISSKKFSSNIIRSCKQLVGKWAVFLSTKKVMPFLV